eukprot:3745238-Prymnesium_polylepis.1
MPAHRARSDVATSLDLDSDQGILFLRSIQTQASAALTLNTHSPSLTLPQPSALSPRHSHTQPSTLITHSTLTQHSDPLRSKLTPHAHHTQRPHAAPTRSHRRPPPRSQLDGAAGNAPRGGERGRRRSLTGGDSAELVEDSDDGWWSAERIDDYCRS